MTQPPSKGIDRAPRRVLEALAAAPEPDPAAAEQARTDLAQAVEDADLPDEHVVRIAAVAALADTA